MKAGVNHRVPLSDSALEVLDAAKVIHDGSDYVFPSPLKPGKPLSNATLTLALRRTGLGEHTTPHGFRSSFRTWALEMTNASWAVAEAALAHTLGDENSAGLPARDPLRGSPDLDARMGGLPVR